jgi:hypothetical protein
MISAVAHKISLVTEQHERELAHEAFLALVRTNEMPLLLHIIDELASRPHGVSRRFMEQQLARLVQLAMQLNRCSAIHALCSRQGYTAAQKIQLTLPEPDLTRLIQMAVAGNNPSMLQSLLQLPAAAKLRAGGLQLVMEECRQQVLQNVGSSNAPQRWLHVEKLPSLQRLRWRLEQRLEQIDSEPLQQQQQRQHGQAAAGQQQQHGQAAAGQQQQQQQGQTADGQQQQQQQQQMDEAALQQAIQAGSLPDQSVRAHLAPGPARPKDSMTPIAYVAVLVETLKLEKLGSSSSSSSKSGWSCCVAANLQDSLTRSS